VIFQRCISRPGPDHVGKNCPISCDVLRERKCALSSPAPEKFDSPGERCRTREKSQSLGVVCEAILVTSPSHEPHFRKCSGKRCIKAAQLVCSSAAIVIAFRVPSPAAAHEAVRFRVPPGPADCAFRQRQHTRRATVVPGLRAPRNCGMRAATVVSLRRGGSASYGDGFRPLSLLSIQQTPLLVEQHGGKNAEQTASLFQRSRNRRFSGCEAGIDFGSRKHSAK